MGNRRIRDAVVLFALYGGLSACSQGTSTPWTNKDLEKFSDQMSNAGKAFAVADVCMPLIDSDADTRTRVILEISAKRYTQLLEIDAEDRLEDMIAFYKNAGGTEEELATLEASYQDTYDETLADLTSIGVCEETVVNFHNTIINAKVRDR